MLNVVVFLVSLGVRAIRAMCRRRADLVLENVALRQQVTALKKERPRPPLEDTERAFWVALRGSWPVWASPSGQNTRTPSESEVYTFPGSTPTSKIGKTHEYFDLTGSFRFPLKLLHKTILLGTKQHSQ